MVDDAPTLIGRSQIWLAIALVVILICGPLAAASLRTEPIRLTDWLLVLVGAGQFTVLVAQAATMSRQSSISERQARLEEKRFIEEFRPVLRIFGYVALYRRDADIEIKFSILNTGCTSARIQIIEVHFGIYDCTEPALSDADLGHVASQETSSLAAGESREFSHKFVDMRETYNLRRADTVCVFSGKIEYFSVDGTRRYLAGFAYESKGINTFFRLAAGSHHDYSF